MPIEIKKVCKALATLWEISDNMENYLDQKGKSLDIFLYKLQDYEHFWFQMRPL